MTYVASPCTVHVTLHLLCTVQVTVHLLCTVYVTLHLLCTVHGPRMDIDLDEASRKRTTREGSE
jgi:hypothetical protein